MTWQDDYVGNLHTMISAMDEHVTKEDAARILIEEAHRLRADTTLEGEQLEKGPNVGVANAAEFAFIWNLATPDHRENMVSVIMARQDEAMRCFMEDHQGLKDELALASRRIAELTAAVTPTVTDDKLGIMAQRFYEVCSDILTMAMTEKVRIVEGLRAALLAVGYELPKAPSWAVEYGHPDCALCEDLAELAIYWLSLKENEIHITRSIPGNEGHWGKATRSS